VVNFFGCCEGWEEMKKLENTEDEITRQLDVVLLMRRMLYLERCIGLLLPEHQIDLMKAKGRPTLEEAEESRKKFYVLRQLRNECQGGNKIAP
jgi:hypothetical protein